MIIFVHLLNDRSGSPRVLKNVIQSVSGIDKKTKLFIGSRGKGVLSELSVAFKAYPYRRFTNRYITLFSYIYSQCALFFILFLSRESRQASLIYINTVLPFGAALFAKICKITVIYHVHEISVTPKLLELFLKSVIRNTASKVLYVSEIHAKLFPLNGVEYEVLYNGYDENLLGENCYSYQPWREGKFRILMLCSLREYKGISQFLELAKKFSSVSNLHFDLVLNDEIENVIKYKNENILNNLTIHLPTNTPQIYYQRASLLLNLSLPNLFIETFGLTLVEAMAFGVPVIAPPIGGPSEIVRDGIEGYLVDSRNMNDLVNKINKLINNPGLCNSMSQAAYERAKEFSPNKFSKRLNKILLDSMN